MALLDWGRTLRKRPLLPSILWLLAHYQDEGLPCRCGDARCNGETIPATRKRVLGEAVEYCRAGKPTRIRDHDGVPDVDDTLHLEE